MGIKTLTAIALAAILGLGAVTMKANAYSCTSYRVGNTTYTNCY